MSVTNIKTILFLTALVFSLPLHAQIPGSVSNQESNTPNDPVEITENPCPDPRRALSETPNDLKVIQEDITRFTLCLQRAQLLTRLNELAEDNIDTINSTLDKKIETMAANMAPMPMPQIELPEIPEIDIDVDLSDTIESDTPEPMMAQPMPEPMEHSLWTINTIKGVGGVLVANITDINGNVLNVKSGDRIEDTDIVITSVTQTSVKVREDKESAKLKWSQ